MPELTRKKVRLSQERKTARYISARQKENEEREARCCEAKLYAVVQLDDPNTPELGGTIINTVRAHPDFDPGSGCILVEACEETGKASPRQRYEKGCFTQPGAHKPAASKPDL